jgi:hypothetical protein
MNNLERLFEETLREATYEWEIDPIDRSWFISQEGDVKSDASHYIIIKNNYPELWNSMKDKGMDDKNIERKLEEKLIRGGTVKIGELDDFYAIVGNFGNREKDIIQGFAKSVSKVRDDIKDKIMVIEQLDCNNNSILIAKCRISHLLEDKLYGI